MLYHKKKLLQIDLIENYNESLEFLKSLAAEELPTSLNVEDKDVTLNIRGLYYLAIHSSLMDLDSFLRKTINYFKILKCERYSILDKKPISYSFNARNVGDVWNFIILEYGLPHLVPVGPTIQYITPLPSEICVCCVEDDNNVRNVYRLEITRCYCCKVTNCRQL